VVALSPSKSHYYVLFIYHVKNIGQVSPNWPIFRNRDIVYDTSYSKRFWSSA